MKLEQVVCRYAPCERLAITIEGANFLHLVWPSICLLLPSKSHFVLVEHTKSVH